MFIMLNGLVITFFFFLIGRQHGLKLKQTGNPEATTLWMRKMGGKKTGGMEMHCALPLYNTAGKYRLC